MKVSIITVSYNAERTIEKTIQSVLAQDYGNIEYLLIDGLSKDNTMNIVNKYSEQISTVKSEKDQGMYDGINKGIQLSSGDIIGILNADDVFSDSSVLSKVALAFERDSELQAVIGDIAFVNSQGKTTRYYSAKNWNPSKFVKGFMPPHPSFYCRRELFERLGYYRTDFEIAADYELLIRFLKKEQIKYQYLPFRMVDMSTGGKSTKSVWSNYIINKEIKRACELNGLKTNYFLIYSKYLWKVLEYRKNSYRILNRGSEK